MGQAFDRDGNVLGTAEGDSKREVFEKLNKEFQAAHEIRVMSQGPIGAPSKQEGQRAEPRDRMLQFFTYGHLPDHLAKVSLPFYQLAEEICATLPSNPERTVALRKLLEAKDCAVRALLFS